MNNKFFNWVCLTVVACLTLLASCKKEEIALYKGESAIYFFHSLYSTTNDSTNLSFAGMNTDVVTDTIWLPVRIMGNAADHDRTINLQVIDSLTSAVEGKHYKLLEPYIMPVGAFTTNIGILMNRTADLQDTTLRLALELVPSSDFALGLYDQVNYLITVNDMLTKPSNWDSFLVYIFTTYSETKYRFMIDVLGRSDFPTSGSGALDYGQLLYYQQIMITALSNYNAAHPGNPMKDENGNLVTF